MEGKKTFLGIDIGSVSIGMVEIDSEKNILSSNYIFHKGRPREELSNILNEVELKKVQAIACTGLLQEMISSNAEYDTQLAFIRAAKHLYGNPKSLLIVGGEKFSLITFDKDGNYKSCKTNTSCAAGTGSFLDQQAKRLGLGTSSNLSMAALEAKGVVPKIASRCSVFAKTDLLHTQQEGYSLSAICNGLCHGLATSIADTLFMESKHKESVVFAGGVSQNNAVKLHLKELTGLDFVVSQYSNVFGALGAAILVHEESIQKDFHCLPQQVLIKQVKSKEYFYDPLELKLTAYPDFISFKKYEYISEQIKNAQIVEVDIYSDLAADIEHLLYLGIDIGSTSTKLALIDENENVVAGFYTRTAGQPLKAIWEIFEAIVSWISNNKFKIKIGGVGTTGSGRKFIGSILSADLIIDEITAHAKAAYRLDPEIETIIEIGGQDSKFTTMKNGVVTFSVMNNVCAAGTGSFIEEQALSLGCSLKECSEKAFGARAPMASDRCTVFMERDVNHYRSKGYSISEVLASTLHSVRENYLSKVSGSGRIQGKICFQGATAKNKALIASFEQKLQKPIFVSKYCHLTGALGICYLLSEMRIKKSTFKGLEIYKEKIDIGSEVCTICNNNCKIKTVEINNKISAYGFMCGRDYETKKFVSVKKSEYNLLTLRNKVFDFKPVKNSKFSVTVGIPATLHLFEDLHLWKKFFDILNIKTISSEGFKEASTIGKKLAGAEFCSPISSFHGHIAYLADKVDLIFVPNYLEARDRDKGNNRQYCYYSQFSSALLPTIEKIGLKEKCLSPTIYYKENFIATIMHLHNALKPFFGKDLGFIDISLAYDKALKFSNNRKKKLVSIYSKEFSKHKKLSVMLLGRPYTILSPSMNKNIPSIFASLGVKTFYQDMLDFKEESDEDVNELLKIIHWKYTANLIKAANEVAKTDNLYPVLITSFKCAPDSCTIEYFIRILNKYNKPYLILQLDEHDSSAGYETRIEAAIRSFQNHKESGDHKPSENFLPISPKLTKTLSGKTLLIPNWDDISCQFIVDNLNNEGIDARLLVENETTIQKSLSTNTGQCIPINCIAQAFIEYVKNNNLKPEETVLWTLNSQVACNLGLYPYYTKSLFEKYGEGFEKTKVYSGELSFLDISVKAAINTYFAFMFGGLLRSMACKIRPYEKIKGESDKALQSSKTILSASFRGKISKLAAVKAVVELFSVIQRIDEKKPKVAIFGDLYVTENEVINQNLTHFIEKHGGEVISTPHTDYIKLIAKAIFRSWMQQGKYLDVLTNQSMLSTVRVMERKYLNEFEKILDPQIESESLKAPEEVLKRFNINPLHRGESYDNILKIFHLLGNYPEIALFVQTSPAFCCPSLVTEAMAKEIERQTGVPLISITYDGTLSSKNEVIIPYLKYPKKSLYVPDRKLVESTKRKGFAHYILGKDSSAEQLDSTME